MLPQKSSAATTLSLPEELVALEPDPPHPASSAAASAATDEEGGGSAGA